jgi:hypothetical protein
MCAARSVHVQFDIQNMPNTKLVLVGSGLDHGEWSSGQTPPNELTPPATSISWQSESDGVLTGTQGWVRYYPISPGGSVPANPPNSDTIWMTWDDPYDGSNSYNSTAPSPYQIGGGSILGGDADNDSAVFTLSFAPQLLQTPVAPALAYLARGPLGSELAVVYVANNNSDELLASTTVSTSTWGQSNPVGGQQSPVAPAMTAALFASAPTFGPGSLVLVYTAANGSGDLLASVSADGVNWSHSIPLGNNSPTAMAPAVASSSSFITVAYVANDGSNDLVTFWWGGPGNSGMEVGVGATGLQSPFSPALAVLNDTFYMVYVANNGSQELFVAKSTDGLSWTNLPPIAGQTSPMAPAVLALGGSLIVAYVADNGSNDIFVTMSTNEGASWSTGKAIGHSQTTSATPSLAQFNNEAVLVYVSNDTSNRLVYATSSDGKTWSKGDNVTGP